jgi:hypothetical protein
MTHDDNMESPPMELGTIAFRVTEDESSSDGIIDENRPFSLTTEFELLGSIPSPSRFTVNYSFESLGAGPEGILASISGEVDPKNHRYGDPDTTVRVEGGTLLRGIYRLTCSVDVSGQIIGYAEGPVIQIV